MDIGGSLKAPDTDFLLALPGLRDMVSGLHPHNRVHLDAESLFSMRSAILPERSALALSRLDRAGRDT
jgi:hypothetical protein